MPLILLKTRKDDVPKEQLFEDGKQAVLKALHYFDIFYYPLTRTEIKKFLCLNTDEVSLSAWLASLEAERRIFFFNGFYSIQNNSLLSTRRIRGNAAAEKLLRKGIKIGRFLYQFPFVRAVGISGSLSKNFADEKSDMDFFIITKANRLWIARTLMHLFKKFTFITGCQHYFCMNYYIDELALPLEDKNIFSAIEIKTLLPVCGTAVMNDFFNSNQWADTYLPACSFRKPAASDRGKPWLKNAVEWLLNKRIGDSVEGFFMQLTQKRWRKKEAEGKRNNKGQMMGLISGKHFARSNPGNLQEKVLTAYEERMDTLLQARPEKPVAISFAK
ncbi:MAG: hypothetical protein HZB42_12050 [Sphingobacteriales bacterium]|nr:hypothetical protein [Sphingobacteriales bacterium]